MAGSGSMLTRSFICLRLGLLVLLTGGGPAAAEDIPLVFLLPQRIDQGVPLGKQLDLLEDRDAGLTLEEIAEPGGRQRFTRGSRDSYGFGLSTSAWWVHVILENPWPSARSVLLRQDYPLIDHIDLWESAGEPDAGSAWRHRQSGDMLPHSNREIALQDFVFALELPANSRKEIFMRYRSEGAMNISLLLHSPSSLTLAVSRERLGHGIFYGALLALALYNLFIFFIVRDASYFFYVLYVSAFGFWISIYNGFAAQYLWPDYPWWANQSYPFFWGLVIAAALAFTRSFLNLKEYAPQLARIFTLSVAAAASAAVISLLAPYGVMIRALMALAALMLSLIVYAVFRGLRSGSRPAVYFMLAWFVLILSVVTAALMSWGVIPNQAVEAYLMQFGAALEMILLSIALASRIRDLERDRMTDSLTMLPNRRLFDSQLVMSFESARRSGNPLSLMVIDIDHFKNFNDRHGHATGDRVLKLVATAMTQAVRSSDYVCRYGGEEFALILPNSDANGARELAERVRRRVEATPIANSKLTVSIGVASVPENYFADEKQFFNAADKALYAAKAGGRNRVVVCDGSSSGESLTEGPRA